MKLRNCIAALFFVTTLTSATASANSWGFRFSPILLAIGLVDAEVNIGVGDHFVISPTILSWNVTNLLNWNVNMSGYGIRGDYHFNKNFSDGWYVGAFYRSMSLSMTYTSLSETGTGTLSTTAVGAAGGYMWQWTHFNMNLGAVFTSSAASDLTVTTNVSTQKTSISAFSGGGLEWNIGWSF